MRRLIPVGFAVAASVLLPAGGFARTAETTISISAQTADTPSAVSPGRPPASGPDLGQHVGRAGGDGRGVAEEQLPLQRGVHGCRPDPDRRRRFLLVYGQADSRHAFTGWHSSWPRSSQSSAVTGFVAANWINLPARTCSGFSCHKQFGNRVVFPAAVARHESAKRVYFYFGVRYGSQTTPPTRVRLEGTGRLHKVHGHTYRTGFSVTFSTVRAYYYEWVICTRDSEARDGLGLPGPSLLRRPLHSVFRDQEGVYRLSHHLHEMRPRLGAASSPAPRAGRGSRPRAGRASARASSAAAATARARAASSGRGSPGASRRSGSARTRARRSAAEGGSASRSASTRRAGRRTRTRTPRAPSPRAGTPSRSAGG